MTTISNDNLFKAYLAYFGRPPDPTGLAAFSRATQNDVIAAFSASPESQDLYRSVSTAAQVDSIYRNLFGRDAEPAGKAYWLNELQSGRFSLAGMAFAVLNGAQNEDLLEVNAKMEVMQTFVSRLQADPALAAGYAGNQAALVARNFLATVTGETAAQLEATKASALAALPAAVQQVSAAGVASGAATPGTAPAAAAPGAPYSPSLPVQK